MFSCAKENKATTKTIQQNIITKSDFALKVKWELDGFQMPESVFASKTHPWLYVSNVNGSNKGFISRVSKNGIIDNLKWIDDLGAPTGSDLYHHKLYVADVKKVHIIDVEKGKLLQTLEAPSAMSLNDVAINKTTGQVFISDIMGGKIYTIKNEKLVVWFQYPDIIFPNGVFVKENNLIIGNYAVNKEKGLIREQWNPNDFGTIFSVNINSKKVSPIATSVKKGAYDGITNINGVMIASSNPNGQLLAFNNNQTHLIDTSAKGIADINTDGVTIYAPYLFNNKIIAYNMDNWERIHTKEQYLEKAAGKFFGEDGGMSVATKDGKIMGNFEGRILSGTWEWKDGFFCRTSTLGELDLGSDCILIEVTDHKMRLTLEKGTGPQVVYDKMTEERIQTINKVNILTKFEIKPKFIDNYIESMIENVNIVRKEPGNGEMRFFQDSNTTTNMFLIGRNKDETQLTKHTKEIEKRGVAQKLAPYSTVPPTVRFLTPIHSLNGNYSKYIDPNIPPHVAIVILKIQPEFEPEFLNTMKKHVELSRKEEGNLLFDFYKVNNSKNEYVVHDEWKNQAAFDNHMIQPHSKNTAKVFEKVLAKTTNSMQLYHVIEKNKK